VPRTPDASPQTLLVFEALLADPQTWRYGYELSRETGLASGTLYLILMRLAERDLLETRWEQSTQPGRPPRHMYRLTAEGGELATARLAARAERVRSPRLKQVPSSSLPLPGGAS
jgi:PadR family transcriptional regulator PadR